MKNLIKELGKLDEVEFRLLQHYIYWAGLIRSTIIEHGLTDDTMAKILNVPVKKIKLIKNGAYDFDFRLIAKLESYRSEAARSDAEFKVSAEGLQFAQYKEQLPIIWNEMKDLIEKLKPNNQ